MRPRDPTVSAALDLLGLSHGADRAAVTRAYRRLALATHPDLSDAADAAARFDALTAAYRRALDAAPRAVEPTTPAPVSRREHQSVHPALTLLATTGRPTIIVGPGRVDPLPTHRRPSSAPGRVPGSAGEA